MAPMISTFYGIIIRMQSERGTQHHKAHIHAEYGEYNLAITIDGSVLEGKFPRKQLAILQGWIAIHEDELIADWKLLVNGEEHFKIEPLK